MRDYKNVRIPRSYRNGAGHVTIKRVEVGRNSGRSRKGAAGTQNAALKVFAVVLIAAIVVLAWQAYQALLHAEMFQIAGVDIKGSDRIGEAELREIAGVFTGQNIFRVNLETSIRRARANPWVKNVRIYRQLPNRISMTFIERVPYSLLDTGGARYLMDADGVVIDRIGVEKASDWRLPAVVVKDYRVRLGEEVTTEGLNEAFALIDELAARGGWPLREVTIKADFPEALSILYAGHEFKIGSGNYAEKLRRLAEILSDGKQRGWEISYVDLRPERQAAVMIKKGGVKEYGAGVKKKQGV